MDFQLKCNIPETEEKISFGNRLIFIGSCFSDEMSILAKQHGFHVLANPFGTLFHPLAIARNLLFTLNDHKDLNVVRKDDVFFDYSCSGKVYGMTEEELNQKVLLLRENLKKELINATNIFITFGTAFAYHLNENHLVVGNCHKQPSQIFTKKMTSIHEIVSIWNKVISELLNINPKIQICFTVSPVRHIKDGLQENNLSKSTLFLAINQLLDEKLVNYFPAFELVNDVLRDYRFFKDDLVHPNQQAIQFVWGKFMETFLTTDTKAIALKVNDVKLAMSHRLQYPESKMVLEFKNHFVERKTNLRTENSEINWD